MATLAFTKTRDLKGKGGAGFGGLKMVLGTLTFDTDYPDDGYTEAALKVLLNPDMNNIVAIIPLGPAVVTGGETGFALGWDNTTNTLRAFGSNGAAPAALAEAATGENALDGATADVIIIGY